MKITILGSGTSTGVPVIGCDCAICKSSNQKDKRLRSSLLVENNGQSILVDTSTDLRFQALKFGVCRVDSVLYTHTHADHIFGIDELRMFNLIKKSPISCYGSDVTIERLKSFFPYIFNEVGLSGFRPSLEPHIIREAFNLYGISITPVEILHGSEPIYGYRFDDVAYLTDCKRVSDDSLEQLRGLELLILGVVRYKPHATHFNLEEALELVRRLKPGRTLLTHLSHSFRHETLSDDLPDGMEPAYDGMVLEY